MTDKEALTLLRLLDKYVVEYGGPGAGEVNPHKMTLAELKRDLERSMSEEV